MGKTVYPRRRRTRRLPILLLGIVTVLILLCAIAAAILLPQRGGNAVQPTPTEPTGDALQPTPTVSMPLPQSFVDDNTASKYIILYDLTNDAVLYSKQADTKCYPASMTKLLTAIVTLKYAKEDTVFTVGDEIRLIDPESSRAYLRIGNRLDLQTLLEALLLPSGNDAAYVAAANTGRIIADNSSLSAKAAIEVFCNEMNATATALGATHSHFANPDGIHRADHYTTAADMLCIAKAAYAQPTVAAIVKEAQVTRSFLSGETGVTWNNTNYLLRSGTRYFFEATTGMKTGHTDQAGYCLTASAEKNGATLITVLMGADSSDGRFEDARGLFTVCFDAMSLSTAVTAP